VRAWQIWNGTFFYYFLATWIMLNVWAIYGLVAYWNQTVEGADPQSYATFIVVNLQTMQLLIQVRRPAISLPAAGSVLWGCSGGVQQRSGRA
jgi:hypothetical protein